MVQPLHSPLADERASALAPSSDSDISDPDTLRAVGGGTQDGEAAAAKKHPVDAENSASEDDQSVSSTGSEVLVVGRNSPTRPLDSAPGSCIYPIFPPTKGGPRRDSASSDMSDGADPWGAAGGGQRQQAQARKLQRQDAVIHSETDTLSMPVGELLELQNR